MSEIANDLWGNATITIVAFPKQENNPYIYLLNSAIERNGATVLDGNLATLRTAKYDVAHFHWPEYFLNKNSLRQRFLGLRGFVLLILAIKLRRKKLVWTMHNVEAHEESGKFLPWLFRVLLFWAVDGVIALSRVSYQIMMERYPSLKNKPFLLSWIGDYRSLYPEMPTKQEAKQHLGFADDQFVIGFFGAIRGYKNVQHLIHIFQQLPDPRLKLLVVGRCIDHKLQHDLIELATMDSRIELQLAFLPESEVPSIVRAIDLMVLPFQDVLNSSSALLALSFDVPLLVPALGSLTEIREEVGDEWIEMYQGELTAGILSDAILWAAIPRFTRAPLQRYNWDDCGKQTVEFYQHVANPSVELADEK